MSTCSVRCPALSGLYKIFHLMFTVTLRQRFYYYCFVIDKKPQIEGIKKSVSDVSPLRAHQPTALQSKGWVLE